MDISVIIPAYNRAQLLPRALNSVLAQTFIPREIIVVDDGSTDNTKAVVENGYAKARYLRFEHQGVSQARNAGIAVSRSEWLAFLDSDDEWLPRKLERQCEALKRAPQYRLCHTDEIWVRSGWRVNPMKKHAKFGGEIFLHCLPRCVISPSSVVIHRSLFERLGGFDASLPACEDYDLWLRICALHPVLYLSEAQLVKYGGHEDQLSRRYWGMDRFRIRALEKLLDVDSLSPTYRMAALRMLLHKLEIVCNGARKRGNDTLMKSMEKRKRYYRLLLQRLGAQLLTESVL